MRSGCRFLLLPLLLTLWPASGSADGGRLGFGFHAGLAVTDHWSIEEESEDYEVDSNVRTGVVIGASATLGLSRFFTLEADLQYVQKGSNQKISISIFPDDLIDVDYRLDYVEIPVYLGLRPFPEARLQLVLAGGPYIAYLVDARQKVRVPGFGTLEDDMDDMDRFDWGFATSTGLTFPTRPGDLRIEYRYTMGFADLAHPTGPDFPEVKLRNYGHYLVFGMVF